MDQKSIWEEWWEYLMQTDDNLHIPMLYVVIALGLIPVMFLCCCCFFCIKACTDDTDDDIHVVPSFIPAGRPRHSDYIRDPQRRDDTEASSSSGIGTVELDNFVLDKVNEKYKKRNYRVPK